jgi:hypothetical protein
MTVRASCDDGAARYHQWVSRHSVTLDDPTFANLLENVFG